MDEFNCSIIGRKGECGRLLECLEEDRAQLVIIYGRRRVGKTYLINEFFRNRFAFKLTGAYQQPKSVQLTNFIAELNRKSGAEESAPEDWIRAFEMLRSYLEKLPADEKQVVFFDEMPWLDTKRSGFLSAFEWFWNDWGSTVRNLVFIVCGSATSWMVDNIANNKGGLFNRQTLRLYLDPFTLAETEEYLISRGFVWSRYDIAGLYMITGGIPYYLSLLKAKYSLSQNIDRMFFEKRGDLWDEFDHLYATLFSGSDSYIAIVEALGAKPGGMTRSQIMETTGMSTNGALTKILKNLVDSGFVRLSYFYGKKKKDALYQLSDYYSAFYLHFVRENYGRDEHFWSNAIDNPKRRTWAGLAFEQLCKDHTLEIKHALGISGVLTEESVWYAKDEDGGAQIDLVMDRRDRVVNLLEMKFSVGDYAIDKKYDLAIRNKIETFRRLTDCRKTIQFTMVTTYGVRKNMYFGVVSNQVVLDDLFVRLR